MRPTVSACCFVICIWPRQAAVVHSLDAPTFFATAAHLIFLITLRKAIRSVTSWRFISSLSLMAQIDDLGRRRRRRRLLDAGPHQRRDGGLRRLAALVEPGRGGAENHQGVAGVG